MDSFIETSKSLQMVYSKQFSQPEYVIIFQIAKTSPMSEILGRQTPTAVALEYTVLSPHPQRSQYNRKKLSINFQKTGQLGQFTIFIIVGRQNEGGVIQMPEAFTDLYFKFLTYCIQKWKYIILSILCFLKMEIYNSLQENIFIKRSLFFTSKRLMPVLRGKRKFIVLYKQIQVYKGVYSCSARDWE